MLFRSFREQLPHILPVPCFLLFCRVLSKTLSRFLLQCQANPDRSTCPLVVRSGTASLLSTREPSLARASQPASSSLPAPTPACPFPPPRATPYPCPLSRRRHRLPLSDLSLRSHQGPRTPAGSLSTSPRRWRPAPSTLCTQSSPLQGKASSKGCRER